MPGIRTYPNLYLEEVFFYLPRPLMGDPFAFLSFVFRIIWGISKIIIIKIISLCNCTEFQNKQLKDHNENDSK